MPEIISVIRRVVTSDLLITQQTLTGNLTVLTGTNAITAGHLNLGSFNIVLNGTAALYVVA